MPKLLPQQYAKILYGITRDVPKKDIDRAVNEFIAFLAKDHALKKLPYIIDAYDAFAKAAEGIEQLSVTSAEPLSDKVRKKLLAIFGEKSEITETVDASMVGGLVVKTGNTILDGSVRTQLEQLKKNMISSHN